MSTVQYIIDTKLYVKFIQQSLVKVISIIYLYIILHATDAAIVATATSIYSANSAELVLHPTYLKTLYIIVVGHNAPLPEELVFI